MSQPLYYLALVVVLSCFATEAVASPLKERQKSPEVTTKQPLPDLKIKHVDAKNTEIFFLDYEIYIYQNDIGIYAKDGPLLHSDQVMGSKPNLLAPGSESKLLFSNGLPLDKFYGDFAGNGNIDFVFYSAISGKKGLSNKRGEEQGVYLIISISDANRELDIYKITSQEYASVSQLGRYLQSDNNLIAKDKFVVQGYGVNLFSALLE